MVGLQNLDLPIGVRVPVSQPKFFVLIYCVGKQNLRRSASRIELT